jgi:Zn-finger nucleic acid-binding protein
MAEQRKTGSQKMSGATPFDCPRCGVSLAMSERQGIEIDYCPQCRGVWLDRGELDKIIERAETAQPAAPHTQTPAGSPAGGWTQPSAPRQQQPWAGGHQGKDYRRDDDRYGDHGFGRHPGKKRKSWLGDLFD